MELADGRFQDTCQSICQRIEAAQSAPDRQVFTWGWSFESPPLVHGGILIHGHSLLDHQPAGIQHLLQRTSALLADDMGLGKTRQAIIAAAVRAANRPILVITLSTLIINWQREIQMVYPEARMGCKSLTPLRSGSLLTKSGWVSTLCKPLTSR